MISKNKLLVGVVFFVAMLQAHSELLPGSSDSAGNRMKPFEVSGAIPQQGIYQEKEFHPAGYFAEKIFPIKNYREPNSLSATIYPTHSFFGLKNPWLGKKVFVIEKVFSSNQLSVKYYPLLEKQNSYSRVPSFAAHAAVLDSKAQGGLDHDEALQQALKKNMNPDEVRELLNKQL